jgi:excinuclease ABC subunit C
MYRRFKIKTVEGNNDFACMYETLARRFQEMKKGEDVSFSARPDLIIIDGGKGQLAYAVRAADDCGVNVNVVSLAKREEEIFIPGREESVLLPRTSLALKLVIRIRDEAHRFAITFHRNLRTKMMTESELEKIEGIGKTKGRNLIIKFKRLENIEKATDEELSDTQSINKTDIKHIREYFERKKSKTEENAQ